MARASRPWLACKVALGMGAFLAVAIIIDSCRETGFFIRIHGADSAFGWSDPIDDYDGPDPGVASYRHWWVLGAEYESTSAPWEMQRFYIATLDIDLILAVPVVVGIAWWWRNLRRTSIALDWICSRCGYDLRATPDRCPECGTMHYQ